MAKTSTILLAAGLISVSAARLAGAQHTHDERTAMSDRREPTIVLHVVNLAALSRDILDPARDRVAKVYSNIGVRTVWVDREQAIEKHLDGGLHLTVMLLLGEMAGVSAGAFGRAQPDIGRAYIFCNRVLSMPGPKFLAIQLGAVIAHEVGHLVLPEKGHSRSGIMRAGMDAKHALQVQSFDKSQAESIRKTLMAGATGR
jgi:hypothetical protein